MINIKECVQLGAKVKFRYCRDGSLWYETVKGDIFPIQLCDIGNAVFMRSDKAILFMKYMKEWNKDLEK